MKFYTSANTVYLGDAYADTKRNVTINQPHACLYGTTVPESLYEGLTKESLTDGFLSRTFIFESDDPDPEPQDNALAPIPDAIIEVVKHWGAFRPPNQLANEHPVAVEIGYSDEAKRIMQALEKHSRAQRQGQSSAVATLWTRTTEKARKLALIHACSLNPQGPKVDAASAQWGADLSEYLTRKLTYIGWEWISENPYEAKRKRVLREIRASPDGLTMSELYRRTKYLQKKERDEIIAHLAETDDIRLVRQSTGGKPRTVYVAT